jgi:hypothetical protein
MFGVLLLRFGRVGSLLGVCYRLVESRRAYERALLCHGTYLFVLPPD